MKPDLSSPNGARAPVPVSTPKPKNPGRVAGGIMGARRRWGPEPRRIVVRLDTLPGPERRIITALIEAAATAAAKSAEASAGQS